MRHTLISFSAMMTALAFPAIGQDGFAISVDGATIAGDPSITAAVPRPDVQLADADLRIQFDGLTSTPRLNLKTEENPGGGITLYSEMNYPGFVTRAEVRLHDKTGRFIRAFPIGKNASAPVSGQEDAQFASLRVYDAKGRYDETELVLLGAHGDGGFEPSEQGVSIVARRGIPVRGGAVTVSGTQVAPGAMVTTLGEVVQPDPSGAFVLQRILPVGSHDVSVKVAGAGQPLSIERQIEVPRYERFSVATVDLTFGQTERDGETDHFSRGRIAGYFKTHYANGITLTGQVDTTEDDLGNLLSDLDERDPRSTILRVDPDDLYPTYGDGSVLVDDTPSSGRIYLKAERDGNFLMWGDYKARVAGGYLRNERSLYGAALHYGNGTTPKGDTRTSVDLYAAQPERVAQRDILTGTGGAVYFLNRQDIGIGTETVSIEVRDRSTGRVIDTQLLVAGRDYSINYIQGVITLSSPLSGFGAGTGIVSLPLGGTQSALVVSYEYSPSSVDADAFSVGGRIEHWVTDDFRIGATVLREDTDAGEQLAYGADLLWQPTEGSFVSVDYARSDGPGFTSSLSSDGGLIFDTSSGAGGTGAAIRIEARTDLRDWGLSNDGSLSAYAERRNAGFSTLDYDVTADETLWGVSGHIALTEASELRFSYDDYSSDTGRHDREGVVEFGYRLSQALRVDLGVAHVDEDDGVNVGRRTDVAVRATYSFGPDREVYGFVQGTADHSGDLGRNDRVGVGGKYALGKVWTVEGEISDGSLGPGGRLLFRHERSKDHSTYFGYELDPDRELVGITLAGQDRGRFILGGDRRIGQNVTAFAENSYDMFGSHRALTSAYGVTYTASDELSYTGSLEFGRIQDSVNGDFDRHAISLGLFYQGADLTGQGRFEFRRDDGVLSGAARDATTVLVAGDLRYEVDETRTLLGSVDAARTTGTGAIIDPGDLVDVKLGYAVRPIDNERLNMLFRYRFLFDTYGEQLAGDDTPGALQRSHILSAEASYDLTQEWTLGAKVGMRLSDTAADSSTPWTSNDAALGVLNARYHFIKNWDALIEVRGMHFEQSGTTRYGGMGALYRHLGPNVRLGLGYNFGSVSSDLADIDYIERGAFINLLAQF